MCFAPLVGIAVNDVTHDVAEDMSWQFSTKSNATLQNSYYIQTRTFPPEYSYQFIRSKYIYIMMDGGGDNDDG